MPVRIAIINKLANNKYWRECAEKGTLAGGNAAWCSHYGKQYRISSKKLNGTVIWPSDSTSENISKETRNTNSKDYMHPWVHCSVIYNSQDLEAAQVPNSR